MSYFNEVRDSTLVKLDAEMYDGGAHYRAELDKL